LTINKVLTSLFDERLAGLVHRSASEDAAVRHRHERFLVSRLATGLVTMAALPPYLLWRGVPSAIEAAAFASLLLPVLAAVILSRTGSLWMAHAVSSAGLTGLVVCLTAMTGGAASPAAVWLAVIPLEALVSGSMRATIAATALAVSGVLLVMLSSLWLGVEPVISLPVNLALPVFALTALGHVAAQALEHLRNEGAWRERLRSNEARDQLLLSAIDDLVTWHDGNGRVIEASASAARLVGGDAVSLQGLGLLKRVHVADRPAYLSAISDVAATGRPATLALRLHVDPSAERADRAQLIHAEMRAHRIAGAGSAGGMTVVAVTRDMTEHYRYAEALEASRTAAERADAVKGRFLANVTHELRTPLNAIIGFSELLSGEGGMALGPERQREYAGLIHQSGHHLLDVVNTLLDISRIQSGNFDYKPEAMDAAELVRSCCHLMTLKAGQGQVALRANPAGPSEIIADPRACRQVLINLISNALKYTAPGGTVTVGLTREADGLELTVADTGIGIAAEDLPRLGTPFFQAGAGGYARSHEGTGLGLSVVQGLVGLHGGGIRIDSAPGAGTTVTVTLPYAGRNQDAPGGPAPIATAVRGAVPKRPKVVTLPLGLFDPEPVHGTVAASDLTASVPFRRAG
jgi:cell cycle sensor histidine kinase DivJ